MRVGNTWLPCEAALSWECLQGGRVYPVYKVRLQGGGILFCGRRSLRDV